MTLLLILLLVILMCFGAGVALHVLWLGLLVGAVLAIAMWVVGNF